MMVGEKRTQFNPEKHHRKSIRIKGYDYSQAGAYFLTMVTHQRKCIFGEIRNGEMSLNQAGKIVRWEWENLPRRFKFIELGAFVVMPNHFQGILIFNHVQTAHPVHADSKEINEPLHENQRAGPDGSPQRPRGPKPASLGAIIGQYKSKVTKRIWKIPSLQGKPICQRNYHDRIIRNDRELKIFWHYIEANPANWDEDNEYPNS